MELYKHFITQSSMEDASLLLSQLMSVQAERAAASTSLFTEASLCGAREAEATARESTAPAAARARVDALLAGVPAPLLILAGSRAALSLSADQRLALELHILTLEEAELRRAAVAADAAYDAAVAREASAHAQMDVLRADKERLDAELEAIRVSRAGVRGVRQSPRARGV